MRTATICSGIGAPEAARPDLDWLWHAEVEPFPSAVMAVRHPGSVNLGDITADDFIERALPYGPLDVVVAGWPCQDLSVAGKREGLAGARSGLFHRIMEIVSELRPTFLVLENVPGLISSHGGEDLRVVLAELNRAGYILDADILDACHFGVPQRRRRVFLTCFNLRDGLTNRSTTSAAILLEWMIELSLIGSAALLQPSRPCGRGSVFGDLARMDAALSQEKTTSSSWRTAKGTLTGGSLLSWAALSAASRTAAANSASGRAILADSLRTKMSLFGLPASGPEAQTTWTRFWSDSPSILDGISAPFRPVPGNSACRSRPPSGDSRSPAAGPAACKTESAFSLIKTLWSGCLAGLCAEAKSSTTSTPTRETTLPTIYTCAEACLSIANFMSSLRTLPESFYGVALSVSTALEAFTNYARSADSDLFANFTGGDDWHLYARRAEDAKRQIERHLGDRARGGPLFPVRPGVRRNPEAGGEAGESAPVSLDESAEGCSVAGTLDANFGRRCGQPGHSGNAHDFLIPSTSGPAAGAPMFALDSSKPHAVAYGGNDLTSWGLRSDAGRDGTAKTPSADAEGRVRLRDPGFNVHEELAPTLDAGQPHAVAYGGNDTRGPIEVSTALNAHGDPHGRLDFESETFVAVEPVAYQCQGSNVGEAGTLRGGNGHLTGGVPFIAHAFDARQSDVCQYGDLTAPLDTDGHTMAVAFSCKDHGADATADLAPTLRAMPHDGSHANGGGQLAVAVDLQNCALGGEVSGTLDTTRPTRGGGQAVVGFHHSGYGAQVGEIAAALQPSDAALSNQVTGVIPNASIRRLTPIECERLQGFSDGYTAITYRGKESADGPRYRCLGNSMAVPVLRWLLTRIEAQMAATVVGEEAA